MRVVVAVALLALLLPMPVQATTDVTVTLRVNANMTFPFDEPTYVTQCAVTVPTGSNAADVLDQAVTDGCIADWDSIDYGGSLGRYLTGITKASTTDSTDARNVDTIRFICGGFTLHPCGALLYSFWGFGVNGNAPNVGVDNYNIANGDVVAFHYVVDACPSALYQSFVAAGTWPASPIPLQGASTSDALAGTAV